MEPVNFGKVWGCKCTLCNPSSAPEEYAIIDSCLSKVMEPVNFGKVWGCKCTLCNPSSAPEEYAIIDSCLSKSYYHKFHQQWGSNPRKLTVFIKILIKLGAQYDLLLIEALKKPVVTCIKPPSPPQTVLDWLLAQRKAIYSGSDGT